MLTRIIARIDVLPKIDVSSLCITTDRVRELSSASGFDVNAAVDGRSPLHFAADYGQLEVIEFLVGKVNFIPKYLTTMYIALSNKCKIPSQDRVTFIDSAFACINLQGADLEAKDKHGISVVLAAIWEGHSKCVAFLISKVS